MDGTHGGYAPLRDEAMRFNQLRRDVEGISQKMRSQILSAAADEDSGKSRN
jgi:DNA-binding HxlR family transcriptional regulator